MNHIPAIGAAGSQTRFLQENPEKAVVLLNILKRLLAWEACMGGWEADVWDHARAAVEEAEVRTPAS